MILVTEKSMPVKLSAALLRPARLFSVFWLCLLLTACGSGVEEPSSENSLSRASAEHSDSVPLVTLEHWRDSSPGERYAFLIGFVTMLELEKEWQGKVNDGRLLPLKESLVASWVEGFAHRPLAEIYNGINRHLSLYPGDLKRPVAEVMWFTFVQPRLDQPPAAPKNEGESAPEG